jgi:hypothetical protein
VFLVATTAITSAAWAGPKHVSVTLKDGTELHGEVVERRADDHVTIKLATGEVRRIEWSELTQIESDEPTVAPTPAPPPPPAVTSSSSEGVHVIVVSNRENTRLESMTGVSEITGVGFVNGRAAPYSATATHWQRVCVAPCDKDVEPNREYRLSGDGQVTSSTFVIDGSQSNVTVHADMGSRGKRAGAVVLLVTGTLTLAASIALLTAGLIAGKSAEDEFRDCKLRSLDCYDNGPKYIPRDTMSVTAGILFGASLGFIIPGILLFTGSSTHVTLD